MPHRDPLITPAALAAQLDAPDLRILDASWHMPAAKRDARAEFADARIPGAQFFDIDEIADTASSLPHMLPAPEKFASRMRRMGIGDGAHVIVYDTLGVVSAARAWWMFRTMGLDDVQVLDGGLPAWRAEGREIEDGPTARRGERHLTARFRGDLVRTLDQMRRIVEAGSAQILDARSKGRFDAVEPEPRPGLRGGHMPGALSLPFGALHTPDGRMKSAADLAPVFAAAGVDLTRPMITSCGSGVTAPIIALALARLGQWSVPVYDGSWTEWGGREDTPVDAGPA
jgi:thiosulfate/3-mercaptopyruvate sulfurtransferase